MRLVIILYSYRIGDLVLDLVRVLVCLKVEEEEERERERKEARKVGSSRWQFMCPPSACPHANTASHDEQSCVGLLAAALVARRETGASGLMCPP